MTMPPMIQPHSHTNPSPGIIPETSKGTTDHTPIVRHNSWGDDPILPETPAPPVGKALLFMLAFFALTIPPLFGDHPGVRAFSLAFVSIVLEALPFMLIGSCVGGLIEVFISRDRLTARLPRRPWAVTCLAAALGLVFPVCECAVVPVVRRLTRKGLPLSAAVAYLLGGPIVNPIVGASTLLAYRFNWTVVCIRLLAGYAIAVTVGLTMDRLFRHRPALLESGDEQKGGCACGHNHSVTSAEDNHNDEDETHAHKEHDHPVGAHNCCSHEAHSHSPVLSGRLLAALRHATDDFLAVAHYLVIGAAIAALAQTLVERRLFLSFAAFPILPAVSMMVLAILLNLCSEADAFIAASFRGLLPLPAHMAFLLTGPMFDLKLLLMYRTLFTRRAILILSCLILLSVFVVTLVLEFMGIPLR